MLRGMMGFGVWFVFLSSALAQVDFVRLAQKVEPSVVTVRALRGMGPAAEGSGVIYRADGYIVTTVDVVRGALAIEVEPGVPREVRWPGRLVGVDERSGVAVVKVEAHDLPAAILGDSERVRKGEWVLVLGNSLGMAGSLSVGVVGQTGVEGRYLHLSTPLYPGNSGAPVFNGQGEMVGLVLARSTGLRGPWSGRSEAQPGPTLNLALASNVVKSVADSLIAQGEVGQGYLGLEAGVVPEVLQSQLGLKAGEGVLVTRIQRGSPAEKAGLQVWDVLLSFKGEPLASPWDLQQHITQSRPGEEVEVEVLRGGKRQRLRVVLETRQERAAPRPWAGPRQPWLGLVLEPSLPPAFEHHFGLKEGLPVRWVVPGSPAERAGLKPWDVLLQFDGRKVVGLESLRSYMHASTRPGQKVALQVLREGRRQTLLLEVGSREGPVPSEGTEI